MKVEITLQHNIVARIYLHRSVAAAALDRSIVLESFFHHRLDVEVNGNEL